MTDTMRLQANWLRDPAVGRVIAALESARPGCARFVGGCVRNTIMQRPIDDIDIAVQLPPQATIDALEAAEIRAVPTGFDHGTITAVADGEAFEVTSLRRDVETDGRRAVVAFTEDWREDAQRRDFRLNALYLAPDGELFDPVGGGFEDAKAGRVVFIGDADERLREDYLRLLRFFRFNAWYGAEMDAEGLAACTRQAEGLRKIARERIWKELRKLLEALDPGEALDAMAETGALSIILPDAADGHRLHDLRVSEQLVGAAPDALLRLMALLPRNTQAASRVCEALRLANRDAARLEAWARDDAPPLAGLTGPVLRAALYNLGPQTMADHAMLSGRDVRDIMAAIRVWRRPEFPITGDDALQAGLSGPQIGIALRRAEQAWVASDFTLDRNALLDLLVEDQD